MESEGLAVYNATIAGCDRSCELRVGNLGTVYANLREEDAGRRGWRRGRGGEEEEKGDDGRTSGGRNEREEGSNANEGEGLYRYVPAAVVCNIMITLPACARLPSSLLSSLSRSTSRFPPARIPSGHPLSAAMLPGNMIIVIICTLLRSYPPDSSPLRNSPVILPAWLPPFSHSLFLRTSSFLSFSLFLLRSIPAVVPSCVMLHSSLSCTPLLVTRLSLSLSHRRLSRVIPRLHSPAPPSSVCRSLAAAAARRIQRKRTRTGPKQPAVNREPLSSLIPFVFRLPSCIRVVLSVVLIPLSPSPFPAVARKTLQCEIPSLRRTFRLAPSLSVFLSSSVSLLIFLAARGPTCSRFLFRSLLLPRSSFPRAVHSNSSLRKRFIDRHSRLFSFGLFLASSNFSRVSNIRVIFQRAKIPRENCRAVRRIKCRCSRSI